MTLSPSTIRLDLKCGKGSISKGEKCRKGAATQVREFAEKAAPVALGLGLAAGMIALRQRSRANSNPPPRTPRIPTTPPAPHTTEIRRTTRAAQNQAEQMVTRMTERRRQSQPRTTSVEELANMSTSQLREKLLIQPAGLRDVTKNTKHNYILGKNAVGSVIGRSITPAGTTVDFRLGASGEVEFRVNGGTGRRRESSFSTKEATTILSRVERMLQASIKDLPDDTFIWTNPSNNDGLGAKRDKLYRRYGFEKVSSDPRDTELSTTVAKLKARNRRTDSARLDLKCGRGAISKGEKCKKGAATEAKQWPEKAATTFAAVGGAVLVAALAKKAWNANASRRLADAQKSGFRPATPPPQSTYLSAGNNGKVYISKDRKSIFKITTNRESMSKFSQELVTQETVRALGVNTPKIRAADPVKGLVEMDFLDGYIPVDQALAKALPQAQKNNIRNSLLNNMSKLHKAGWGHGDFHYKNVLFKDGDVALIDWGNGSKNMVRMREDIWRTIQLAKDLSEVSERSVISKAGKQFMDLSSPKQKDVDNFYDQLNAALKYQGDKRR